MIILKSASEIAKIREAGRIVARAIRLMHEAIVPGKSTTRDLDAIAARVVAEAGGSCAFLNYRGYPASTCISVNEVVIHGIPNDKPLMDGDIIDLDIGVEKDGWFADAAWTYPIGSISPGAQRLLNVSQECLHQGIAKARLGNRVGDISAAVQRYAERNGYGVVTELVGHGIGRSLHEEPNVPNFGKANTGPPLREGMTICIEPMINQGTKKVKTLADGWTIVTADGKLSAHFEHTVAITRDGPELLTVE